ncbi:MAG: CerR family C-terminal domain-containing protein [Halieaceae bacterium]|nr:CerR family C-terminal domain-containing protein [Halieaceae bacterium]
MTNTDAVSRGDHTRETLIISAIEVFSHSGFDAASTRAIAVAAGVNQGLISYHFGSKQRLYLATFEYMLDHLQCQIKPLEQMVSQELAKAAHVGPERRELALNLMQTVMGAVIDLFSEQVDDSWVRLLLREQQEPGEAYKLLYDGVMSHLLSLLCRLISMVTDLPEESEACRIRAFMLLGQVLILRIATGAATCFLGWETLSACNVAAFRVQFQHSLESQFPVLPSCSTNVSGEAGTYN